MINIVEILAANSWAVCVPDDYVTLAEIIDPCFIKGEWRNPDTALTFMYRVSEFLCREIEAEFGTVALAAVVTRAGKKQIVTSPMVIEYIVMRMGWSMAVRLDHRVGLDLDELDDIDPDMICMVYDRHQVVLMKSEVTKTMLEIRYAGYLAMQRPAELFADPII